MLNLGLFCKSSPWKIFSSEGAHSAECAQSPGADRDGSAKNVTAVVLNDVDFI